MQSKCVYEAYVKAVTTSGVAEVYSSLFPDIAGAASISMWHHRVGLTTLYYYVNQSSADELREALEVTLDNQAVLQCDETDESLVSPAATLQPHSRGAVNHEVVLKPGEAALYMHRPCSSDGASSSVARSCNIVANISPDMLMDMTRTRGEVRACMDARHVSGGRCLSTTACPAFASTRCSTQPCMASWLRTARPRTR